MKHLKKKFLKAEIIENQVIEKLDSIPVDEDSIVELKKSEFEGYYATLIANKNVRIQAFKYKDEKSGNIFLFQNQIQLLYILKLEGIF